MSCPSFSHANHAFANFNALECEGVAVTSRRNMLKASLAGIGGLTVPNLMQARAEATSAGKSLGNKSVILLWMTGGPSHIDTWDPKPNQPLNNRGPFATIDTAVPGISICEHLPKQAAMMDRFTLIRSVDCKKSSHQPNQVMQTGDRRAMPRTRADGDDFPGIASVISRHRKSASSELPNAVSFFKHSSHVAWGGYLGKQYDPFDGNQAAVLPQYNLVGKPLNRNSGGNLFQLPSGLNQSRMFDRKKLMQDLDQLRMGVDLQGSMNAFDVYQRQAYDMVLGKKAQQAFDISREPEKFREMYGNHLWSQQALLARRLVEAGVGFVTIDLSYHTASGTWDNHGIPGGVYGGISKGLKPILPLFDHILTTLVGDLETRGILDDVLVVAMGEFGRTPNMGTQKSTDGRNHWPVVMSMCLAGGGFRHGQVIGASTKNGGEIHERPVTPADIAATIYKHMGVPLDGTYEDHQGRPHYIVQEDGQPIQELV